MSSSHSGQRGFSTSNTSAERRRARASTRRAVTVDTRDRLDHNAVMRHGHDDRAEALPNPLGRDDLAHALTQLVA